MFFCYISSSLVLGGPFLFSEKLNATQVELLCRTLSNFGTEQMNHRPCSEAGLKRHCCLPRFVT